MGVHDRPPRRRLACLRSRLQYPPAVLMPPRAMQYTAIACLSCGCICKARPRGSSEIENTRRISLLPLQQLHQLLVATRGAHGMELTSEIASHHEGDAEAHAVTFGAARKVVAALAALRAFHSNDPTHLGFVECLAEALAKPAPDVNAAGPDGATALLLARARGNATIEVAAALVALRALHSNDPTHLAFVECLAEALAKPAPDDVNAAGPDGATALLLACAREDAAISEELLSVGADPEAVGRVWHPERRAADGELIKEAGKYSRSPLTVVAFNGNITIAELLLARNDLDANQPVDDGRTALFVAAQFGHADVAKMVLAHDGIDANKAKTNDGATPLFVACQNGHDEIVKLLLAHDGIDANKARTDDGCTPLSMVCQDGHDEVVKLLLAHDGIDANKARTDKGCTPIYMACHNGHDEVVKLLLAHDGIDANKARTDDRTTPLHAAVMSGNLLAAQHLVTCGADMNTTDNWNETPAQLAADEANQPALAAWLKAVARWSVLRVAAGCRLHCELATLLRQGRMDPDSLTIPEIVEAIATSKTQPAALPWDDAPPVCERTVALVADATRGWHRSTHWLHRAKVREAVFTVLVAADRLYAKAALPQEQGQQAKRRRRPTRAATAAAAAIEIAIVPLPTLPPEIWLHCLGFVLRSWWAA